MRLLLICLVSLLIQGCADKTQKKRLFDMDYMVHDWIDVDPENINKKISLAKGANASWLQHPALYVENIFDIIETQNVFYKYQANSIEDAQSVTITLVRDGFLDDSIKGDVHILRMIKKPNNIWEAVNIKKAVSCWRSESHAFQSKPCP